MMTGKKNNTDYVSDDYLVDYLLHLLPDAEHTKLQQRIDADSELQQRLNVWENALFSFHDDTAEQIPPKRVWRNLEKKLFADEKQKEKHRWWQSPLRPALFSIFLTVGIGMYLLKAPNYQPSNSAQYHATVNSRFLPITLWEVEGNKNSISFTSIRDVSDKGLECVAWIQQDNNPPVKLGVIPDSGDRKLHNIKLPKQISEGSEYNIIIAMVKHDSQQLPQQSRQHIATFQKI